ncbi:hypothetical protein LZZ85_08765 [Terrimonas sp. NA20]|uniref:Uncharacterized protein n=1 Tax=Terrimonas ginsenosidimutans TaxID=2908004 RepID=A0ABS9KPY6_9BACT|nr:hypothetical protein [Terrimonas ginsenosidimutans]MCG2614371.1 hypothetical protein [Terrimonas ginsenosidimutans]
MVFKITGSVLAQPGPPMSLSEGFVLDLTDGRAPQFDNSQKNNYLLPRENLISTRDILFVV